MEILIIPDLHIGEKEMSMRHIRAIREAIIGAIDRRTRLRFVGDMFEMTDITDRQAIIDGCKPFRSILLEYWQKTRFKIAITLGNHDRYLTKEHLNEFFPGVPFEVHQNWLVEDGVLIHHGHLADVAGSHILDHLDRNTDNSLVGIQRFITKDKAYRKARRDYHARNMIDLWALMRFAEQKIGLSNRHQLKLYDAVYSRSLDGVNQLLKDRDQAQRSGKFIEDRHKFPSELAFNEALADNTDTELWAIGNGHWHKPYVTSFLTSEGKKPVMFNAGMGHSTHHDPSCIWINTNNPTAKTCRLFTYTDGNWRMHSSIEYKRSSIPYLTQPRASESMLV